MRKGAGGGRREGGWGWEGRWGMGGGMGGAMGGGIQYSYAPTVGNSKPVLITYHT